MTAARELGVRLIPSRGSMDLGESDGGLPPDSLVEDPDDVLAETERLASRYPELVVAPCSPFSVTGPPDARVGGARAAARADAAHAPRGDRRGGGVLPGAVRLPAGRVPRAARLARRRRLVRALRPPRREGRRAVRRDGHGSRALSDLEPAARRGGRAGASDARRGRPRRARRRRLGLERAGRPVPGGEAGAARRAGPRGAGGADGAPGALARHAWRRGRPEARRHRLARARQERGHRRLADGRARVRRRRTTPSRRSCSPARTGSTGCWSAARTWCATDASSGPTRSRSRRSTAARRRSSQRERLSLDPCPRHRARPAGRRHPRRALARRRARRRRRDGFRRPNLRSPKGSSPATTAWCSTPASPFFRRVELEVQLGDGHHHIPLLVSSYSCMTYRGS